MLKFKDIFVFFISAVKH